MGIFDVTTGNTMELVGPIAPDSSAVIAKQREDGYRPATVARRGDPLFERRLASATNLLADCIEGRTEPFLFRQAMRPTDEVFVRHLENRYPGIFDMRGGRGPQRYQETMSYSDFGMLTDTILDRVLYGYWSDAPVTNWPLVKKVPLRDLRTVSRYVLEGGSQPWSAIWDGSSGGTLTPHAPGEPPTERALSGPSPKQYTPAIYQAKMSVNWSAIVNDNFGIFNELTQRLAIGGRRTIYRWITSQYVGATGPNPALYNSGFANLITRAYGASTDNPPLDFQGLIDGLTVLNSRVDADGEPITIGGTIYLWYGPGLMGTAKSLIKAITADISIGGGTTNAQGFPSQRLRVENWPAAEVVPIEDKYIPFVCTASGVRNTMWGLTYDPTGQPRPSIEVGMLTGYDSPTLFKRAPETMRMDGTLDPMMGSFDSMDQDFKGLMVFGGGPMYGQTTVSSTGAGS